MTEINQERVSMPELADRQREILRAVIHEFITTVIGFIIVAFVVFLIAKAMIKPVPEKDCPYCGMTIAAGATRCPHCTSQLAVA